MSKNKKLAIITFVYNEKVQLPRWLKYYASQVESGKDLYILDHGSDDGSTNGLEDKYNLIRLPRTEGHGSYQKWRVDYVSSMASKLLNEFESVIYCDSDEYIFVNDGRRLIDYVSSGGESNSCIGYDVLHDFDKEPDLGNNFVSDVRGSLQLVAAMCKPVLVSNNSIRWAEGFHSSTMQPKFGDLILFHLRYADLSEGIRRLSLTRTIHRPEQSGTIDHQKIDDETFKSWLRNWLKKIRFEGPLDLTNEKIAEAINNFKYNKEADGVLRFDYSYRSDFLLKIPALKGLKF
jgi:glycosyltransferase involved in cell wall biosynthesis